MMGVYVVDSNFFIQAHRVNYPLDVARSFWSKIEELAAKGIIISVDKVRDEIFNNKDGLTGWCQGCLPDTFFKDTTTVISAYTNVAQWVSSMVHHYHTSALTEFLAADEADAWIVSYALGNGDCTIVTHERSQPERKNKIK